MDSPVWLLLSPCCENGYLIVALYTAVNTMNGNNTKINEINAPIIPSQDIKPAVINTQPKSPKQIRPADKGSRFFFG